MKYILVVVPILVISSIAIAQTPAIPATPVAPSPVVAPAAVPAPATPTAAPTTAVAPAPTTPPDIVAEPITPTSSPTTSPTPANPTPSNATPPAPVTEADKTSQEFSNSKIQMALSRLPTEKAKIFDATLRRNLEKNRDRQQQVRALYKEIRENFNGIEFNKGEFLVKSQLARDLQTEIRASLDEDLGEIADKYTQEERQIIFEALPARYTRDMMPKPSGN